MAKKRDSFTPETEALLIQEVHENPILWDVQLEQYRRSDLKDAVWENIASKLGPNFTAAIVKDRFGNMRTFMNNERKIKESRNKCSGSSTQDVYRPKWHLYNSLLFLRKSCTPGASISIMNAVTSEAESDSIAEVYDESAQAFVPFHGIPTPASTTPVNEPVSSEPTPSTSTQAKGFMYKARGMTKRGGDGFQDAVSAIKRMADISIPPPPPPPPTPPQQDQNERLGAYVARNAL